MSAEKKKNRNDSVDCKKVAKMDGEGQQTPDGLLLDGNSPEVWSRRQNILSLCKQNSQGGPGKEHLGHVKQDRRRAMRGRRACPYQRVGENTFIWRPSGTVRIRDANGRKREQIREVSSPCEIRQGNRGHRLVPSSLVG